MHRGPGGFRLVFAPVHASPLAVRSITSRGGRPVFATSAAGATTGDRVNCQRWIMADRQGRQRLASQFILQRNESQNRSSGANALFDARHAIYTSDLVRNDAAKRRTTFVTETQDAAECAWVVSLTTRSGIPPMLPRRVDRCLLCRRREGTISAVSESRNCKREASEIMRI
jgi:hypothetical protein